MENKLNLPLKKKKNVAESPRLDPLMRALKALHSAGAPETMTEEELEHQRRSQEVPGRLTAPMAGMDYEEFSLGGMNAAWMRLKAPHGSRHAILYCHGGGYTSGNLGYARVLASKLAHVTGYDVLSFEYRLAPEHPYPAAVEDALFSNVQFRTVQMSELYSIIIASHQAKESRTKHKLQHYLVLISVLSAVLVLLFVYLCKQLRKVYRIKEELSQTNAKLARLNEELGEKNEQLSDSNAVKVQYIARFFDLCSMYIDKMDDYRKSLKKLAQDRKFDELNKRLKSTSMLEDEQDELYKNFDAIFLNLYPSFVEDFNALLTEDERIVLKSEDLLNKELRIYALLRLGITDSVKIASFLRCSLSTVYNYRTKVRNKAAISREEFEKMVMKIGTAHKTDV